MTSVAVADYQIFISYRRADHGPAGRLADLLKATFGTQAVFFDVDDDAIPPGDAFPASIDAALRDARVVLVVIGAGWIEQLNARASGDTVDYVRREVEIALERFRTGGICVIPVCVGAVPMPDPANLVPDLRATLADLFTLQSSELRPGAGWKPAYAVLEKNIQTHLTASGPQTDEVRARLETERLLAELGIELRKWVCETLDDASLAERRLFKPLNLAGGVERTAVLDDIDRHARSLPHDQNRILFVAGEEGTGKTVAVAQWLRRSIDNLDVDVLYTSAQESNRWSHDPVEFLRQGLRQRADGIVMQLDALRRDYGLEDWITRRPWFVIVDGINEEGDAREWGQRILGFSSQSRASMATLFTTRTEHLERRLQSYRKNTHTTTVDDFSRPELKELLRQHGLKPDDIPAEALPLLHRPRYFQRALRHRHALAGLRNINVPLLIFLDWRERAEDRRGAPLSSADFERLLLNYARKARDSRVAPLGRRDLRDSFSIDDEPAFARKIDELLEQRVVRDNAEGTLEINKELLPIALGLLLLEKLQAHPAQNHIALREAASGWLGDQQDDLRGEICHAAAVAALSRGNRHPEVTIALLERWLMSQNAQEQALRHPRRVEPLSGIRRLYSVAAAEILALIRWTFDEGRAPRLLGPFADLLIDIAQDVDCDHVPIAAALYEWLGLYSPHPYRTPPDDYALRERQARQLDDGVMPVAQDLSECRLLSLAVLSQLPTLLSAAGLRRVLLSVAADGFSDALGRLCWLLRVVRRDCLEEIQQLLSDCDALPALQSEVGDVARSAWPALQGHAQSTSSGKRYTGTLRTSRISDTWYLVLRDRLLHHAPDDRDIAKLRVACEGHELLSASYLHGEIGFAIALYLPELFGALKEKAVILALDDPTESGRFAPWLLQAAPLLTADQARRVRLEANHRFRIAGFWHQPPVVRAAYIGRRAAAGKAVDNEIAAASLDPTGCRLIVRRILRTTSPDTLSALFYVLIRVDAPSRRDVSLLLQWLRRLPPAMLSDDKCNTVIQWLMLEDRCRDAVRFVPSGWIYAKGGAQADNWSRVLAASGQLTFEQAVRRLSTTDLPRWAACSRATHDEWRKIGELIDAVLDEDARMNWPASAVATETDPFRDNDGLREALQRLRTTGQIRKVLQGEWPSYEIRAHLAETVQRFITLDAASVRRARGFLRAAVEGAVQCDDDDAPLLLRALWAAENSSGQTSFENYTRDIVRWAFRLADSHESRTLWDDIADELRTDDELVRFVACAQIGNGEAWLRQRVATRLNSPLPGQEVEAAVLAGAAGFTEVMRDVGQRIDDAHGWRKTGFVFAMELDRDLRNARAWCRRFYTATQWTTAYGAFMAYLQLVDVRLAILGEAYAPAHRGNPDIGQTRYHYTWREEVDEAVKRRQKVLRETLFGVSLMQPHLGRWSHMRKLL